MFRINYIVFNPAMSKSIQQVSTNLEIVETSGSVYSISMVSSKTSALMLSFLTVALHESGTRKSYISGKGL